MYKSILFTAKDEKIKEEEEEESGKNEFDGAMEGRRINALLQRF